MTPLRSFLELAGVQNSAVWMLKICKIVQFVSAKFVK
jgi:hypothetical protein